MFMFSLARKLIGGAKRRDDGDAPRSSDDSAGIRMHGHNSFADPSISISSPVDNLAPQMCGSKGLSSLEPPQQTLVRGALSRRSPSTSATDTTDLGNALLPPDDVRLSQHFQENHHSQAQDRGPSERNNTNDFLSPFARPLTPECPGVPAHSIHSTSQEVHPLPERMNRDDPVTYIPRNSGIPPISRPRLPGSWSERHLSADSPWTPSKMKEFRRRGLIIHKDTAQQPRHLDNIFFMTPNFLPGIHIRTAAGSDPLQLFRANLYGLRDHVVSVVRRHKDRNPLPTMGCLRVCEHVAIGGYSRVYRFSYSDRIRPLAVKIRIRPEPFVEDDEADTEWQNERRALNRLAGSRLHPSVLVGYQLPETTIDIWSTQGVALTVFDYHPENLSMMRPIEIGVDDQVKTRLYAAVAGEIASGLNHLHSLNIIHRDIKPPNILINFDGHCIIADYGACEMKDPSNKDYDHSLRCIRRRAYGGICTTGYTALETIFAGLGGFVKYGEASDVWSLGVTIYSLTTNSSWLNLLGGNQNIVTHAELGLDGDSSMCQTMEDNKCPDAIRGLVLKLCQLEPEHRIPRAEIVPATRALILDARGIPNRDAPFAYTYRATNWNYGFGISH